MSVNATGKSGSSAVSEQNDKDIKYPVISDALQPLLPARDQVLSEEAEIEGRIAVEKAALSVKHEERKRIEKILVMGGIIKPPEKSETSSHGNKGRISDLIAPHVMPTNPRSKAAVERGIEAIEDMGGEPFQISMVCRNSGLDRKNIERAIGVMRGEDRMRLLGKRPQIERSPGTPGGAHALTFQEIR